MDSYFSLILQEAQQQAETTGQGKRQSCSVRQTSLALSTLEGFLCQPLTWTLEQCSEYDEEKEPDCALVLKMLGIFS